jgi:hypothetical protein
MLWLLGTWQSGWEMLILQVWMYEVMVLVRRVVGVDATLFFVQIWGLGTFLGLLQMMTPLSILSAASIS